ncbi:MAG: urea amidolyase [Pseudomonadota bacterium]
MSGRIYVEGEPKLLTVQDSGRRGAMRFGVSASGPMDWVRFAHALALCGGTSAAFEVGVAGATFRATGEIALAVTGPGFSVRKGDREAIEAPARIILDNGERLSLMPGRTGMWAYVAIGGIDFGTPVLGSYATNTRTGLGMRDFSNGFEVSEAGVPGETLAVLDVPLREGPIGLLPGPQHHLFDEAVRDTFAATPYSLTNALDRMGYRLEGAPLKAITHDIISDGIVEGAIQVPGNGQPIVLCADRAPTGGYPKIAVVASADLPRLTQSRPGTALRFQWIDLTEAERRRSAIRRALSNPAEPRVRSEFSSQFLAERNLIGGVVAADLGDHSSG